MVIEPQTMSVADAAKVLGLSRSHAYQLVATGEIPTVRLGKRIKVPVAAIETLLTPSPQG